LAFKLPLFFDFKVGWANCDGGDGGGGRFIGLGGPYEWGTFELYCGTMASEVAPRRAHCIEEVVDDDLGDESDDIGLPEALLALSGPLLRLEGIAIGCGVAPRVPGRRDGGGESDIGRSGGDGGIGGTSVGDE
jgi:hypothetical protein